MLLFQEAGYEGEMSCHGGEKPVIVAHDAEPLGKRLASVGGGGPFVQIVNKHFRHIAVVAGALHASDTPLILG